MNSKANRGASERVLFEERPRVDTSFFAAIVLVLLTDDSVVALLLIYFNIPREVIYAVVFINIFMIAFVGFYVHFRSVKLTDQRVYIRFGISRSAIPISNIISSAVSDPPTWSRIGPGVSGWRGRKVYCFKTSSPFVMIEHGSGRSKRVFFNVDRLSEFMVKLRKIREH